MPETRLIAAVPSLAGLVPDTSVAAGAAMIAIGLPIDAGAGGALSEAGLALALAVHTIPRRCGAGVAAGAAVERVRAEIFAAAAAIFGAEGTGAGASIADLAAGAHVRAAATVILVGARVVATVRARHVELRVEQVGVADAGTILTESIRSTPRVAVATSVVVPQDADATVPAVDRPRPTTAVASDAVPLAAPEAVAARITQESTA